MKAIKYLLPMIILPIQLAVASPITSIGDSQLSGATINDFESLSLTSGSSIALGGGVTVTGNNTLSIINGTGSYGTSGQVLSNTNHIPWTVDFMFDDVISAMGIVMGAINSPWTVTAYDIANNVIETANFNDPCCDGYFRGIAANGIKHVTYSSTDWIYWDDLRYVSGENNDIPEPATLLLMGLGLAGIGWRRKKAA